MCRTVNLSLLRISSKSTCQTNCMAVSMISCFRAFATALIYLNEYASFLNLRVVTPSVTRSEEARLTANLYYGCLATSVMYGISEPLFALVLLWLSIPPWILLLALSPSHLPWSFKSMETYEWLQRHFRQSIPPSTNKHHASSTCNPRGTTT